MKIHSPSPHKQVPSKCNDYFFNYFTLGVVSCDSSEKRSLSVEVGSVPGHTYVYTAAVTMPGSGDPSPSWLCLVLSYISAPK